jgi:proteasome lid subunit RPN8/RPN11
MRLPRELAQQIAAHALAESPHECCGFIAFADGDPVKVFEATNLAQSDRRFEISGAEQHKIVTEILDAGWTVGAIYHSHPRPDSDCWPSAEDIRAHVDPEILSVIVQCKGHWADFRAFCIYNDRVVIEEDMWYGTGEIASISWDEDPDEQ